MKKRTAALLLFLMLLTGARAREAYVVQAAGIAALVDAEGADLINDVPFDALFEVKEDELYAVGSGGDYALYDAQGNRLGDERYAMLEAVGDAVLCRKDGLFGALDLSGETLIAPEWAQLTYAGDGAFLALSGELYDDQPDEIISIDARGARVSTGSYTADGLRAFSDGRMMFTLSDGGRGYVDVLGRQVIPPEWRSGGDFCDGVAIVSGDAGMGLIDVEGRVVVDTEYDWIERGDGLIAALTVNGRLDVYAPDASVMLFTLETVAEAEVCGGCVVARDADTARLYDKSGACVCEAGPGALFFPGLDGQIIMMDGGWGEACQRILNPDGSVASGDYQYLLPLCGGRYASLYFDDGGTRYGLLDAEGREVLSADYLEILPAGEDRLVLVTGDSVCFADMDGCVLREWPVSETAAPSSEAGA